MIVHTALLAGAGTGKTHQIILDIAKRIDSASTSPSPILAITFSRKATQELRQRLQTQVGAKAATSITVSTFHALAASILRENGAHIGFGADFTILYESDIKPILKSILEDNGVSSDRMPIKDAFKAIECFTNTGQWPELIGGHRQPATIKRVYKDLQARLRDDNSMTFSGMIMHALHLLETRSNIREEYASKYRHIYVDEFQDTNIAQYKLLKLLAGERTRLFVVGDDDQSIFSWRYVEPRMIEHFRRDFKCKKTDPLVENHRSSATIVDAANGLIAHNKDREDKELVSTRPAGELIRVHRLVKQEHEGKWIADTITELREQPDGADSTIAILCRHKELFKKIEKQLRQAGVAHRTFNRESLFEQEDVKLLLDYLRAITNTKNTSAITRIINTPSRSIGKDKTNPITDYAKRKHIPFWDAAIKLNNLRELMPACANFVDSFSRWQKMARTSSAKKVTTRILKDAGFGKHIKGDAARRKAINGLRALMKPNQSVPEFMDDIIDEKDDADLVDKSAVQLMTIHAAKGLQFAHVFLPAWERKRFPYFRGTLEEERRLAYVAITRAEERVFISSVLERRDGLKIRISKAARSQFIKELPTDCVKRKRSKRAATWLKNHKEYVEPSWDIEIDDVVSHNAYYDESGNRVNYGVGVVTSISGKMISMELDNGNDVTVYKTAVTKAILPLKRRGKKT